MKEVPINLEEIIKAIDQQRKIKGFLSVEDLLDLTKNNNIVLDPFSTLINSEANIGEGNTFYPSVTIEINNNGKITIGNNNIFHPQTFLLASKGEIVIGNNNQLGDGGVSIKANQDNAKVTVEDNCRLLNQIQVLGITTLGTGCQVIGGPITVQDCFLNGGNSYDEADPDLRAGVLKGFGLARNIRVMRGEVINGEGMFNQSSAQRQSDFHPKK